MTADPYAADSSSTTSQAAHRPYREVTDSHGRVYRVGETDRDILGHSRRLMVFAALTPDYFGENYNATNYGLVYSGKLISGLFGGGLGSMVVAAWGYNGAYALAGGVSMLAAAVALLLRRPGRAQAQPVC